MSITKRSACSTALAAALVLGVGAAQAALLNFTLTGVVTYADADPNAVFGLGMGSTVTATGVFDDASLTGIGNESISFGSGSGNSISLNIGNSSYTAVDDTDYMQGDRPEIRFSNGAFAGLNFMTDPAGDTTFQSLDNYFYGDDYRLGFSLVISGTWTSLETSPIPVPAAAWLLGSGLLGLAGVARRKAAA